MHFFYALGIHCCNDVEGAVLDAGRAFAHEVSRLCRLELRADDNSKEG